MRLLIDVPPGTVKFPIANNGVLDNKSYVAPFRVVNIGNSKPTQLLDFVGAFEKSLGIKAVKNLILDAGG